MADWTLFSLLSWAESYFKSHDIDSPRLTAEILLAHCLDIQRLDLYLQYDRPLQPDELDAFKILIQRRIKKEPVAYIVGKRGFFESEFKVGPGVLIPRPDTETVLVRVLEFIAELEKTRPVLNIIELGVGSGAIIVSLAVSHPGHQYFGCDISVPAIDTARINARQLSDQPVQFFRGSWLDAVKPGEVFDIIVSNPPYIRSSDIGTLMPEVREFEPVTALDGGTDGGDCLRAILEKAHQYMTLDGKLFLETGFDQKELVSELLGQYPFYEAPEFKKDLTGKHRVVILKKRIDQNIII